MRDFVIFALSFSSLHTTVFALSARGESAAVLPEHTTVHCPYFDAWSLLFLLLVFSTSGVSLYASAKGWDTCSRWTWAVDASGVLPGMLWQISTRPSSYGMGSLPLAWDFCSHEHVPAAQLFRMLGEWLTYGSLLRLTQSAGFGTRLAPSILIVSIAAALSGVMYALAILMRDMFTSRAVVLE